MTPTVAAAEKLSRFDPKRFLSTIDGGSEGRGILQEADDLRSGRSVRCCFYIQKGKVKTHRRVEDREGSHHRHSQRGRFLRRRLPYRVASSPYPPQPQ